MKRREGSPIHREFIAELAAGSSTIRTSQVQKPRTGAYIAQWRCPIPGELNRSPIPMISVHAATEHEFRTDPNYDRFQTCIWILSKRGRPAAQRIARELAETGVAIVYPSDWDLTIHYGARHQIVVIGQAAAAPNDKDDEDE